MENHPRAVGILTLSKSPVPVIEGMAEVGKKLTAVSGTRQPKPVKLRYQWLRDGKDIDGATSAAYTLTAVDAGAKVSVRIIGSKLGYASVRRTSAQTAAVKAEPLPTPTPTPKPTPKETLINRRAWDLMGRPGLSGWMVDQWVLSRVNDVLAR